MALQPLLAGRSVAFLVRRRAWIGVSGQSTGSSMNRLRLLLARAVLSRFPDPRAIQPCGRPCVPNSPPLPIGPSDHRHVISSAAPIHSQPPLITIQPNQDRNLHSCAIQC